MVLDPNTGRVLLGYADGCPTSLCNTNVRGAKATIGRQTAGPSLLTQFDAVTTPAGIASLFRHR